MASPIADTYGQEGFLTDQQQEILKRFIEDSPMEEIMSAKFSIESIESVCLRFLRARQFDLAKARVLLTEAFNKKIEHKVSEKIKLTAAENAKCDIELAKNWYPHSMPGFDKLNRPILFEHTGMINPSVLSTMTTKENLVCYHWWVMENLLNKAFETAAERSQRLGLPMSFTTFVILDFEGLSSAHCNKAMLDHVKGLVSIDNCCYPEILGRMVVVNAPWLTVGVWNLVKGWLDPRTQAKIDIMSPGAESVNKLLEYVDADIIAQRYGGTGPPFFTPRLDAEVLAVPRSGQLRRQVVLPAGCKLVVDNYIADGSVDFTMTSTSGSTSTSSSSSTNNKQTTSNPPAQGIVRATLSATGSNPSRFLFECPAAAAEEGSQCSDRLISLVWNNPSRFSSRSVVYSSSIVRVHPQIVPDAAVVPVTAELVAMREDEAEVMVQTVVMVSSPQDVEKDDEEEEDVATDEVASSPKEGGTENSDSGSDKNAGCGSPSVCVSSPSLGENNCGRVGEEDADACSS